MSKGARWPTGTHRPEARRRWPPLTPASLDSRVLIRDRKMSRCLAHRGRGRECGRSSDGVRGTPFTPAALLHDSCGAGREALLPFISQDLGVPEIHFLAAIQSEIRKLSCSQETSGSASKQPFCWPGLGVDIRGRSSRCKVNYRTSQQIMAYRLLPRSAMRTG